MSHLTTVPHAGGEAQTADQRTHLPKEPQENKGKDVSEDKTSIHNSTEMNSLNEMSLKSPRQTVPQGEIKVTGEQICKAQDEEPGIEMQHTTTTQSSEDRLADCPISQINIKDFAYNIDDPRHFGIYPSDDDADDDEGEEEEEEEDDHDIKDTYDHDNNERSPYYEQEGIYQSQKARAASTESPLYTDGISASNINTELSAGVGRNCYTISTNDNENNIRNGVEMGFENTRLSNEEESNDILHAVALYEFTPENSNELPLVPDQLLIINYECGDGWLVAHDPSTGQTGLVPSEYIRILEIDPTEEDYDAEAYSEFAEDAKDAQRFMPEILADDSNHEYSVNLGLTEDINKLSI